MLAGPQIAVISERLRLPWVLESIPHRDCLAVINHHRIGHVKDAIYDAGVISASPEQLDEQIRILKRRYRIVGLEEALDFVYRRPARFGTGILLTFDDGYIDNYETAFPILRSHNVPATFFLSTGHVGSSRIPWWDQIAFILRNTSRDTIRVSHPEMEIDLRTSDRETLIRKLLEVCKFNSIDIPRFVNHLEEAGGVSLPRDPRLFLDWTQAAEMVAGGMSFGSHTHNHEILAKLPDELQFEELSRSRTILQERLKVNVDSMAYPVGKPATFTIETMAVVQRAGYRAAFSFYGGANLIGSVNPFDVRRLGPNLNAFRFQLAKHVLRTALG